jgi:hypothetical protein
VRVAIEGVIAAFLALVLIIESATRANAAAITAASLSVTVGTLVIDEPYVLASLTNQPLQTKCNGTGIPISLLGEASIANSSLVQSSESLRACNNAYSCASAIYDISSSLTFSGGVGFIGRRKDNTPWGGNNAHVGSQKTMPPPNGAERFLWGGWGRWVRPSPRTLGQQRRRIGMVSSTWKKSTARKRPCYICAEYYVRVRLCLDSELY